MSAEERERDAPITGGVHVVARAIEILRTLGDASAPMSLTEISERTGLPRSTVHRIVQTLRQNSFVTQASGNGGLRLGPELGRLAAVSRSQLVPLVRPFLEQLSRRLDQGASLAVLDGPDVRFLDQAITGHGLRAVSLVGSTFPAHCTANGKALLAELAEPQLEATLPDRLRRMTSRTIVTRSELMSELARVRAAGMAFDREEHADGICAVGRIIHDAVGNLAAISVAMPARRFYGREEELAGALSETTARVIAALSLQPSAGR